MPPLTEEINHWILLRGLAREQRHWGAFLPRLQAALPGKHFHCLDVPGSGGRYQQRSPASVTQIRRAIAQEQQTLDCSKERFGVIGLSLGGMIALDWMAANPAIAAVVVINSSAGNFPLRWRFQSRAMWLGLRALCSNDIRSRERLILRMVSRKHSLNKTTIETWASIQASKPVRRGTILRQLWAAANFLLPANINSTPGMVLTSGGDDMVSSRCSQGIAQYYDWPLRCNRGAGHDLPLDDPDWVVEKIVEWTTGQSKENVVCDG